MQCGRRFGRLALAPSLLGAAYVQASRPPQSDKNPPDAVTDLAPDSGAATRHSITLTYRHAPGDGSVYYAWRDAGTWHVDQIDSGREAKKNAHSAFDPIHGYPTVAYGIYYNGDYSVRLAEKIAGFWNVEVIREYTGCIGQALVALAYYPTEYYPGIAHTGDCYEGMLYSHRTPSGWSDSEYVG